MRRHVGFSNSKEGTDTEVPDRPNKAKSEGFGERFERLFGFRFDELSDTTRFVRLLNRPMDPACLGVMRFMYGLIMVLDAINERGMSRVTTWDDPERCHFPLFNFLKPLPVEWMVMVYLCITFGAVLVMLGLFYRVGCTMLIVPYWYLFWLDKTRWNNHSYLFGLTGIMLLLMDANRYWSLDGLIWPHKRHAHVPLWNYTMLRTQFFLVYFIAGLKKLDADWVTGYSLKKISHTWVFLPFQQIMTEDQIELYIVHTGGLVLDLFIGYFLFFDFSRPLAMLVAGMFHLMNSQIFSIGMFPWTMIATTPIFCYADWPRHIFKKISSKLQFLLPLDRPLQPSSHCVYDKEDVKSEKLSRMPLSKQDIVQTSDVPVCPSKAMATTPGRYHKVMAAVAVAYLSWQCFMPYSHFITRGYNSWTQGLYGYSWDMMIYSWKVQHVKVTYVDKDTGEIGYLKPGIGTLRSRWSSQADMLKQYSTCMAQRLRRDYNISNPAIFFDVWRSMNKRFNQRIVDPRVDILTAPWSPFRATPWLLPVLDDLSDWREELKKHKEEVRKDTVLQSVLFIADFPGMKLENYVREEYKNATIKLLQGSVILEDEKWNKNITLSVGETVQLTSDAYHNVYTVSSDPSCYMYVYGNSTNISMREKVDEMEKTLNETAPLGADGKPDIDAMLLDDKEEADEVVTVKKIIKRRRRKLSGKKPSIWKPFKTIWNFAKKKYQVVSVTLTYSLAGIESIVTGRSFAEIVNGAEFVESQLEESESVEGLKETVPVDGEDLNDEERLAH